MKREGVLLHQRLDGGLQLGDPTAGMQTFTWARIRLSFTSRSPCQERKGRTNYDVNRGIATAFGSFDGPVGIIDGLPHE